MGSSRLHPQFKARGPRPSHKLSVRHEFPDSLPGLHIHVHGAIIQKKPKGALMDELTDKT